MATTSQTQDCLLPHIDFAHEDVPDLHTLLASVRDVAPIVPIKYWGERRMLIHRHDLLKQAWLDDEHFRSADAYRDIAEPSMGRTIQVMFGEEHRRSRFLVSGQFTPKALRDLRESLIEPIVHELLDRIEGKAEVDLVSALTQPFPFRVITRLIDLPVDDEPKFLSWAVKLLDYPWDPEGAVAAKDEFTAYLSKVLAERRANPGSDLLSRLAQAELDGERLSDEEIFSFCRLLFPAGSDTTYKGIGSLLLRLLGDPDLRALTQESDETRRKIVLESLRLEPPVPILPRVCSKDVELGGIALKAGEPLMYGIAMANRDPAVFDDPERFDPERKNLGAALSFGQGEHHCIGRMLALAEMEIGIKAVFERFPKMTLMDEKPSEIVLASLRGPRDLWVRPGG